MGKFRLGFLAAAALPIAALAANLNFLSDSAVSYFTQEDVDLMVRNVQAVVGSADSAAQGKWTNPKTGNTGRAEVRGGFTGADGAPCKRVFVWNRAVKNGVEGQGTYTMCRYASRGWLVNPEAQPSGPKQ